MRVFKQVAKRIISSFQVFVSTGKRDVTPGEILLRPRMSFPTSPKRRFTRKSRLSAFPIGWNANHNRAYFNLIGSWLCLSNQKAWGSEFAVRRQVKLAPWGKREDRLKKKKKKKLSSCELSGKFLLLFYELIQLRSVLTTGTNTLQDEKPQVSVEKARSHHNSKLFFCVFWLSFSHHCWRSTLCPHTGGGHCF